MGERSGSTFGAELRARRLAAEMTLTALAETLHYSKSYVSRIELGQKPADAEFARRCEAALGCPGELVGLVPASAPPAPAVTPAEPAVAPALREQATGVPLWPLPAEQVGRGPEAADLEGLRSYFDFVRGLGQRVSPGMVLPIIEENTKLLLGIAARSAGTMRSSALTLAARFAEYAGWMQQEQGDIASAKQWTEWAVEFAAEGGDHDLVAYGLVREALIAFYQHDAYTTIELARGAQAERCGPRVRGLAAQREAQGHALGGDYDACQRALERASRWLSEDEPTGSPVIGTTSVADPAAMTAGWCMVDLGRAKLAMPMLRRELDRIPMAASRSRARYGARLAIALVDGDEIEEACAVMIPVLSALGGVRSMTIRSDVQQFLRLVTRWRTQRDVAMLMPALTAALRL
jgi:transcriptional regulator with XRE-family HTH domain